MGQIVRDGLTHGRCFRYRIAFVLKKKNHHHFQQLADIGSYFPNISVFQAFKLSAQHGGVEYVQGEVTQVPALQK